MTVRNRRIAALTAVVGITVCVGAIVHFFRQWTGGNLELWPGFAGRELYLAAGQGYAKGFTVGFFLAFFLIVLSLAVASWWEQRRRRRVRAADAVRRAAVVAVEVDPAS